MPRNSNPQPANPEAVVHAKVIPPKKTTDQIVVEVVFKGKTYPIRTGFHGTVAPAAHFRDALEGKVYDYDLPKKLPPEVAAMTFAWIWVTPEKALEGLASVKENRRLHMSRVNRYAAMMHRGEWLPWPDPACFDPDGTQINAYHRFAAIAIFGKPVLVLIAKNVPLETIKAGDQGLPRGAADWLHHEFDGLPPTERLSAILRFILLLASGGVGNQFNHGTAFDIAEMYVKNLQWLHRMMLKDKAANGSGLAIFRSLEAQVALVLGHSKFPKTTSQLVEDIIDGSNLRVGTPARVLKDWLVNIRAMNNPPKGRDVVFGVLRAIEAAEEGEKFSKSIPKGDMTVEALDYFVESRRELIPVGTFLEQYGKKGGDPATRNSNGQDPRA